nr:YWFCY domain-containing protein [Prevotella intermedia]
MDGAFLRLRFFFLNWWLLALPIGKVGAATLYIFTLSVGYICLLMGGVWMSRLLKNNLMDDVFNTENESFMQETRLMENEYSVNLPTRFYYKKRSGTKVGLTWSIHSVLRWCWVLWDRASHMPS